MYNLHSSSQSLGGSRLSVKRAFARQGWGKKFRAEGRGEGARLAFPQCILIANVSLVSGLNVHYNFEIVISYVVKPRFALIPSKLV